MPAAVSLLSILAMLGIIAGALWYSLHLRRRREATWRIVAERRGGRFLESSGGLLRTRSAAIEAVVEQAVVRLDTYVVRHGKSSTTYTRARARFAVGGPVFKVYVEGFFSSIGKALGAQDVELGGHPGFDDTFMVKCKDVDATRVAWTDEAKGLMLAPLPRHVRAVSDGTEVTVVGLGAYDYPALVDAMLDLAGELASFGARDLAALADLEDASFTPAAGTFENPRRPTLTIAKPTGTVEADVLPTPGAPRLRLTLDHASEIPTFSTDVGGGRTPDLPPGVVPEGAEGLLRSVAAGTLVNQARCRLRLTFADPPGHDEVATGVELLLKVGQGSLSRGAFR